MDKLKFTEISSIDQELLRLSRSVATRDTFEYVQLKEHQVDELIQYAAVLFNVSVQDIRGKSRLNPVSQVRQVLMWYLRNHIGMTFEAIGHIFKRDHSTVLYGCRVVDNWQYDHKIKTIYSLFMARFI